MTTKELIELLQKCPQDSQVWLCYPDEPATAIHMVDDRICENKYGDVILMTEEACPPDGAWLLFT